MTGHDICILGAEITVSLKLNLSVSSKKQTLEREISFNSFFYLQMSVVPHV